MTQEQLQEILTKHLAWCNDEEGGERADLSGAFLSNADLSRADLHKAFLSNADLSGANIDYSCWPLWCGSIGVTVDVKIIHQLAFHLCAVNCDDAEWIELRKQLLPFANKFHRVGRDVKALEE